MDYSENFKEKTLSEKIDIIDKFLDNEIRTFLQRDNGDLELVNVVEKNDNILVYIEYQGACVGCDSQGGTMRFIESLFLTRVADNIRVFSV